MTIFIVKQHLKMSDKTVDRGLEGKPILKLRRSKTINVSHFGGNDGRPDTEVSFNCEAIGKRSPSPAPTSSCQALKHAVSALTRIDDFILEKLGDGFFANVYKATHRVTNEEMVMKINKDSANRPSALREVQLMNRLSHPNILRFLGVCVHEGQLHALTEYISGGTLEELLAKKDEELPWTLRIKLSLDIARGMHYLHLEGVFHRDLTSKNILIKKGDNRNYQAVIADFGLATKIPDPKSKEPLPSVGCPWWMAPEVIHGQFYDERADLFSYGIILLEITTRIDADPETMPRTKKFGVDYIKLCEMVDYCPLDFLQLAFKCCQILPELRPSSMTIISNLEKIYKNLRTNSFEYSGKLHKRSRSEDNIIQNSDSLTGIPGEEVLLMTPQIIAQAMTKDDPHYCPANANPFASISKFKDGRKLLEFPRQRKCSLNGNGFGVSLIRYADHLTSSFTAGCILTKQESQSLPCSPIMLRKAAEKLHQASLHGSYVVEAEDEAEVRSSVSADNQESDATAAAEKRARFGCSRTRSLGSLDFWHPLGAPKEARVRKNAVHQKGYCNRLNSRIRESSVEDQLSSNIGESSDEIEDESVYSECNMNVNHSMATNSFRSFSNQDETSGAVLYGSCDESFSCCSLSSYVSCGEHDENSEVDVKVPDPFDSEQEDDPVIGEFGRESFQKGGEFTKPLLALTNGSYDPNHFGQENHCAEGGISLFDTSEADVVITKL